VNAVGIMQGRLSPPVGGRIQCFPAATWRQEFGRAREAGIDRIEWIYDEVGPNPLMTDAGLAEVRRLATATGVEVRSVCADYFMTDPLLDVSGRSRSSSVEQLIRFLERAEAASLSYVILPFVDSSSAAAVPSLDGMREMLRAVLASTASSAVELHLETDLEPQVFSAFLKTVGHPRLRANLDIGNSASLGHDADQEMTALGSLIGSVHIKDRVRHGGTVPLGTGDADFDTYFRQFTSLRYRGPFILQVARSSEVAEVEWARRNRAFVQAAVDRASAAVA